jgi:lipopolysaccharide biosynthesis regulator YciM
LAWRRKKPTLRGPSEVAQAWRRGLRAAVSEDWLSVETWLERIVEAESTDLDAYHALARLYRRQGAVGRAIRMHQNLLLQANLPKKDRVDGLFELARDFEDGGFGDRAAATYEEFLDLQPRHAETLERIIPLLANQREFARALVLVKRLRRLNSEVSEKLEIELLLDHARCSLDEGDHDTARKALKRCLRRQKTCAKAWTLLGELETERGKAAKALDAWKHAASSDPDIARELYSKIPAGFAAKGKAADFDAYLREILTKRPDDAFARIALARALASRGENHTSIEDLSRAIELSSDGAPDSDSIALRAELGRQLLATHQDAEALKAYGELIKTLDRAPTEEETVV